jgi:hypothetical protein
MAMAVYPFWGAVAAHVGRLLRLQGNVTHAQVRRRVVERYGQRTTVKDAVRRVLRSMIDWGVLKDAMTQDTKGADGSYVPGVSRTIGHEELIAWLAEAFLHAYSNGSATTKDILESPSFFPFRLPYMSATRLVSLSPRLDLSHHGLSGEIVMLR